MASKACAKTLSKTRKRRMGDPPKTHDSNAGGRNPTTRYMAQSHNNDSKRRVGAIINKEKLFSRTPTKATNIHNAKITEPPKQGPYRRNANTRKSRICAKIPATPLRGQLPHEPYPQGESHSETPLREHQHKNPAIMETDRSPQKLSKDMRKRQERYYK